MNWVRTAAVAGMFYPADAQQLTRDVHHFLEQAPLADLPATPKALIVPHAGYQYSGAVAARAYALLQPVAARIRRVVLLGPAHRVALRGMAVPGCSEFVTPLGSVVVDQQAIEQILALPQVGESAEAHRQEHSLEVHLPFLQTLLPQFQLVPLVVGQADAVAIAQVLEHLWGGDETLIVISSDLSHYLSYDQANQKDGDTVQHILALRQLVSYEQACGGAPINGLLAYAQQHRLQPHLLHLCNSGDTGGDKMRVVGYCAFAFTEVSAVDETEPLPAPGIDGSLLVQIARMAIASRLGNITPRIPDADWLHEPGATFVTLTFRGRLRGCIGSLVAHRELLQDVTSNAQAAAFRDPRFSPLTESELPDIRVEVSLLSPMQLLDFASEQEALAQIRPGIDGVLFECDGKRGTYLPQVWDQFSSVVDFMGNLKIKAGLSADFWSDKVRLSVYQVTKWREEDV